MATPARRSGRDILRLQLLDLAGLLRPPRPMPAAPRSILIVRPDHLGDAVMATPAIDLLRESCPGSRLTAWIGPWAEEVWRDNPSIDAVRMCAFPGFSRQPAGSLVAPYALAAREARGLRHQFDLAINLRFDFWWGAMAASMAGIPVVGYDLPECRPFLSFAVPYVPGRHEVEQNVELVRAVVGDAAASAQPRLSFVTSPPPVGLPDQAIAIHPGTGAAVKLWDEQRWAQVADALSEERPIVLTAGSPDEEELAERIRGRMRGPATVAAGLTLAQLGGMYRRCRIVLGVDSGPMHVARAVGTPTVTLFGPIDPAKFGPYPRNSTIHEVVRLNWRCIPCERLDYNQGELKHHLCVRLIASEQVLQAARRVLRLTEVSPGTG